MRSEQLDGLRAGPVVLALLGLCLTAAPAPAQVRPTLGFQDLVVTIQGMGEREGALRVALFDSAESFTEDPLLSAVLPVDSLVMEWRVALPAGVYAVAVIHDRDGNGELNTNLLGMPRERYGFSNDARGAFGPPSFEDASFSLSRDTAHQVVEVR